MRSPEHLQLARASACSKEVLSKWYVAFKQFVELNGVSDPARVWNADETGCPLCPKSGKVLTLSGTKDVYQATSNSDHNTMCDFCCRKHYSANAYFLVKGFIITLLKGVYPVHTLENLIKDG